MMKNSIPVILSSVLLAALLLLFKNCQSIDSSLSLDQRVEEYVTQEREFWQSKMDVESERYRILHLTAQDLNKELMSSRSEVQRLSSVLRDYKLREGERIDNIAAIDAEGEYEITIDTFAYHDLSHPDTGRIISSLIDSLYFFQPDDYEISLGDTTKWYSLSVLKKADGETVIKLKTFDEIDVVFSSIKGRLFKPRESYVTFTNKNPYVHLRTQAAIIDPSIPRSKRFGVGLNLGYGINSDLNLQPSLQLGLQYNLLSF